MKYCRYCGKQLQDDARFCSSCGNSTDDGACPSAGASGGRRQNEGRSMNPPPYYPPSHPAFDPFAQPEPPKPLDVVGLIGLIISVFTLIFGWGFLGGLIPVFSALAGVILSSVGLAGCRKHRMWGLSVAGLIVGIIGLLLFMSVFLFWIV